MSEEKQYTVKFSEDEYESLQECLTELLKKIRDEYESSHPTQRIEPIKNLIFIAACELKLKLAKVKNPNTTVTLEDYLK